MTDQFSAYVSGFLLNFGMIVGFGPQNLFLVRQGMQRSPLLLGAAISSASDMSLIAIGVLTLGSALTLPTTVQIGLRYCAACYVTVYALTILRSKIHDTAANSDGPPIAARETIVKSLVMSLANPSTWLETIILLGAAACALEASERLAFSSGAMCASLCWFCGLELAARHTSKWCYASVLWYWIERAGAILMLYAAYTLVA